MATNAMKRWPYLISFVLFVAVCASLAYWAMQLFKPPARSVAAPPAAQTSAPKIDAAAALFGGRSTGAAASNYQLTGLVLSGNLADSVVILSANGEPPRAYRASKEIAPGITVKEVHPGYIVLSENGATRRVEMPADIKSGDARNNAAPVRASGAPSPRTPSAPPPRTMPAAPQPAPGAGAGAAAVPPAQPPANAATAGVPAAGQPVTGRAQQPVVVSSPPTISDPATAAGAAAQQAQTAQQAQQAPAQPGISPAQPPVPGSDGAPAPVQPGMPQPVPTQ